MCLQTCCKFYVENVYFPYLFWFILLVSFFSIVRVYYYWVIFLASFSSWRLTYIIFFHVWPLNTFKTCLSGLLGYYSWELGCFCVENHGVLHLVCTIFFLVVLEMLISLDSGSSCLVVCIWVLEYCYLCHAITYNPSDEYMDLTYTRFVSEFQFNRKT